MDAPLYAFDRALEEIYTALPEILSRALVDDIGLHSPLAHPDQQAMSKNFSHELLALRQRCRCGLESILAQLKDTPGLSEKGLALETYMQKTFTSILNKTTFTKVILRAVSGETWADALKVPPQSITLLYQGAKNIFEEGRFEEAEQCFIFLSWFDSKQYDFWMALGHCQFHTDKYSAAIKSYGIASYCLPTEGWPFLYSASCFEAMNDIEQTVLYLKEGLCRERSKAAIDQNLVASIEQKLEECRRGPTSTIS